MTEHNIYAECKCGAKFTGDWNLASYSYIQWIDLHKVTCRFIPISSNRFRRIGRIK